MTPLVFGVIALVVVAAVLFGRLLAPSVDRAVGQAVAAQSIDAIVRAVEKRRPAAQPDAYNHAIRSLWDGWQRPLAVVLVRHMAEQHADARITQYWVNQALAIEPALARQSFDETFLASHYRPEVAAACGPVG